MVKSTGARPMAIPPIGLKSSLLSESHDRYPVTIQGYQRSIARLYDI